MEDSVRNIFLILEFLGSNNFSMTKSTFWLLGIPQNEKNVIFGIYLKEAKWYCYGNVCLDMRVSRHVCVCVCLWVSWEF